MALPSQIERSAETSRPIMTRTGGAMNLQKPAMIAAALLLAAGAVYGISRLVGTGGAADGSGGSPSSEVAAPTAGAPAEDRPTLAQNTPAPTTPTTTPAANTPVTTTPATNTPTTTPPATAPTGTAPTGTPAVTTPAPTGTVPSTATPGSGTPTTGTPGSGVPGEVGGVPAVVSLSAIQQAISSGDRALADGRPLEARSQWTRAYMDPGATDADKASLRDRISKLNADLLFSAKVTPGDTMVEQYTVQSGDSLVRIARRRELATDWRLIARVNGMSNPDAVKVGQKLKLIRGPFHAIVDKSEYRLDLFTGSPDEPERWQYVRSFRVGLGEGDSTPLGTFVIRKNSKLVNPPWVNPRTGERFRADDPKNPIGEHWLGFQGVGQSAALTGYGLHGTIEPDSIGQQRSMGCVRMATDDIAMVYELLVEEVSVVKVVP